MAYLPKRPDEEQQGLVEQPVVGDVTATGGTGAPLQMEDQEQQAVVGQPQQKRSGQWTNIQRYLSASKPATEELAGRVAGQAEQSAVQQFRPQAQQVQQRFGEQVSGSTVQQAPDVVSRAIEQAKATGQVETPTAQQVESLRTAEYQGPRTLQEAGMLSGLQQAGTEAAAGAREQLGSETGRSQLLQSLARGRYTPGMGTLDQMLLQMSPEAQERLLASQGNVQTAVDKAIAEQQAEARALAEQGAATTAGTREATQQQLTAGQTGYEQALRQLSRQRAQQFAGGIRNLTGGAPSAEVLATMGVTPSQYAQLQNLARQAAAGRSVTAQTPMSLEHMLRTIGNALYTDPGRQVVGMEVYDWLNQLAREGITTPEQYWAKYGQNLLVKPRGLDTIAPTTAGAAQYGLYGVGSESGLTAQEQARQNALAALAGRNIGYRPRVSQFNVGGQAAAIRNALNAREADLARRAQAEQAAFNASYQDILNRARQQRRVVPRGYRPAPYYKRIPKGLAVPTTYGDTWGSSKRLSEQRYRSMVTGSVPTTSGGSISIYSQVPEPRGTKPRTVAEVMKEMETTGSANRYLYNASKLKAMGVVPPPPNNNVAHEVMRRGYTF